MTAKLQFEVTRTLPAPLDAVWKVLGDFGAEHRWASGFSHCERDTTVVGVGTARTCTLIKPLMGRTKVREELTEYQPGEALAYALDGPAGPFASAASRWATRRLDDRSTLVTVEGNFTPRNALARFIVWPLAKPMIRRLTGRVLAELETFLTAQEPSAVTSAGGTGGRP